MKQFEKYEKFYKYTDTNSKIGAVALELKKRLKEGDEEDRAASLVCYYINDRIWDRTVSPPAPINRAKTLLISRFTKATTLIITPQASCGSVATLAASILRTAGYKVRLVHGSLPNTDQHAWNEIWMSKQKRWHSFDCSSGKGKDYNLSENHVKILDCVDWDEISTLLISENEKNLART